MDDPIAQALLGTGPNSAQALFRKCRYTTWAILAPMRTDLGLLLVLLFSRVASGV
jgi:hypothetical protein